MNMKDLAKLLGVSRQTVSAVLNGKEWVSQETRARVLQAIREHNYAPNQHAVSLTGKSTKLLGVVLRDISNPFYTQIAMGIESVARASGYSILYHNTFENHDHEVDAIRSLLSFRVSGIIISPIQVGVDLSHLEHVTTVGIPMVSIDKLPNIQCHSISFADHDAAFKAACYMADQGHERIAFIKGPESAASAKERLSGFLECAQKRNLNVPKDWLVDPGTTDRERHDAIYELIKDPAKRPTAVFCFNDLLAVSVYKAAHELGIRIPQDLSVVGFDDIEIASLLGPALTTVRTDSYKVGVEAAEMVMAELKGATSKLKDIRHTPQLVERSSVAVPVSAKKRKVRA
jgi:DNA-binding LacI/PurR family transcriptional regulator